MYHMYCLKLTLVFSASFPVEYSSQLKLNDNIIIYYNSEYEVSNRFTYIHFGLGYTRRK